MHSKKPSGLLAGSQVEDGWSAEKKMFQQEFQDCQDFCHTETTGLTFVSEIS
jgi:hypothetical protein